MAKKTYQVTVVIETTFTLEIEAPSLKEAQKIARKEWNQNPESFEEVETDLQQLNVEEV